MRLRHGIADLIRKRHSLDDSAAVGVVGVFGKDARVDRDNRDIVVMATTDDMDLEREVVVPEGADTGYFFRNRSIFVDHQYTADRMIGKLRSAAPRYKPDGTQKGWLIRVHVLDLPNNPLPDDILTAAEHGIGASIGFEAKEYGPPTEQEMARFKSQPRSVIRKWHWLETSLTFMPCNVACQSQVATVDDTRQAVLDELVTKGKIRRESARLLGLRDTIRTAARVPRTIVLVGDVD